MDDAPHAADARGGCAISALPAALVLALEAACLGLACLFLFYPRLPEFVATNTLPDGLLRTWTLSLGAVLGLALGSGILHAARKGPKAAADVDYLSRLGRPLLLAWALPLLFNWRVFEQQPWTCVVLASLFGLGLERALRSALGAFESRHGDAWPASLASRCPDLARRGPLLVAILFAVFFTAYIAFHTIHQHNMLKTQSIDMAAQENIVWNLLHGNGYLATPTRTGREGSHLQDHAPFLAPLYALVYGMRQKTDTLLFLQAAVAGAAILPLFLFARLKLGSPWPALAIAFAYMVHAPLHGALFYDFHYLTQAPFFVFLALHAFESGRRAGFVAALAAALLVREDVSAGLAVLFLFLLAEGRRPAWAFWSAAACAAYFVCVKFVLMPSFAGDSRASYTEFYRALIPPGSSGFGAVLATVFTNPGYTLGTLIDGEKLLYVLQTCGPLLFLPVRGGRTWMLLAVPAMFTVLSVGYPPLVQPTFQYTSHWTACIFPAAVFAMARWRNQAGAQVRLTSAALALAVTAAAFSYSFGAMFQRNTFRGGFRQVQFTETRDDARNRADLYSLIALIPPAADVAATENEAPHVAARRNCFTLRLGAQGAEYLLVNRELIAKGIGSRQLDDALRTGEYGFVASSGRYGLWRRGAPMERTEEGLRFLQEGGPAVPLSP